MRVIVCLAAILASIATSAAGQTLESTDEIILPGRGDVPPEPTPLTDSARRDPIAARELPPDHYNPGDVIPRTLFDFGSIGITNAPVVAPNMRFPLESGPAFANSQIFNSGGYGYAWTTSIRYPGPEGPENAGANFNYPWRDNFCEVRRRDAAGCPGGVGHQGQDLRAATCEAGVHWAVAVEDGVIKEMGENHMVLLYGYETGQVYVYLHMVREPKLKVGLEVKKGERLGRVSNILSAKDKTTTHLHFEIWSGAEQEGESKGVAPLSPYTSLVEAYLRLIRENPAAVLPVSQPADSRKCRRPG
jgi:murein DD-endopeptidase MepM/ murein hydrolase activator NlpD